MAIPKDLTEGIVLKKDGLYRYNWDDGQHIHTADSLVRWLREPLYIDDGVTFETFFDLVMLESEKISDIFQSHLGGYDLSDWADEWNQPDKTLDDAEEEQIDHVELRWSVEYHSDNPEYGLDDWVDFGGRGRMKSKEAFGDDEWHDTNFGFSFTPINEIKHYPFKIRDEWRIFDWNFDANLELPSEERYEAGFIFNSTKVMTVYDVIGAILFDISFYGPPTERQDKSDELTEQVEHIKEHPEECITMDVDEFIKKVEEEDLDEEV